MKKQKCIILIDTDRVDLIDKTIIDAISSYCDIRCFYLPERKIKKIPCFYKRGTIELHELLNCYNSTPLSEEPVIKTTGKEKTDFVFSLNGDFDRSLSEKIPVIYLDRTEPSGLPLTLNEFIKNESFINIRIALCYKHTSHLLSESKLKIDRCFFQKNFSFLHQVLPGICIQAVELFVKSHGNLNNIPVIDDNRVERGGGSICSALILCYLLMPFRLFKKVVDFLCYWEQWHIGIVEDNIEEIIASGFKIDKVRWLPAVKKHQFVADPFGIKHNNRLYIFAELWDSTNPVGKIVWGDESDSFSRWNTLFNHDTHLSYPFILRDGEKIYCTPESGESGDFTLYTAERFPEKWNKGEVLFRDFRMADASLLFYNNKYWLFAAKANGDAAFELCIWFSDRINGGWKTHPMNPVKRDITSARPAGPLFIYKNTIYRPAQDCSDSYGSRIVMNRVSVLSETDFREEIAGVVKGPGKSPYPDGMHTLSVIDDIIVIDAKRKVFTLLNYNIFIYKIKRILTRINP